MSVLCDPDHVHCVLSTDHRLWGSPLLSVIMPSYNEKTTIREIVAAVLGAPVASRELIIVDDASTDGTRSILCDETRDPSARRGGRARHVPPFGWPTLGLQGWAILHLRATSGCANQPFPRYLRVPVASSAIRNQVYPEGYRGFDSHSLRPSTTQRPDTCPKPHPAAPAPMRSRGRAVDVGSFPSIAVSDDPYYDWASQEAGA